MLKKESCIYAGSGVSQTPIMEKGERRVIEEDNQLYNRERLCQPQQQKIPCKEYRSETESLECGILQSGYSRNIP